MLKGALEHFALADIFRLLSWAKKTGKLEVVRSAGHGKIFFREGEVYYAESSVSREPLGQKLIRSGSLSESQLMKALDQNAQTGERVGQVLIANGWVSEDQLQAALKQQIEDAVFDLLRWELGEFDFQPFVEADIEVQISVSVENLIIEASRRLDELEVIQRKIPSEMSVLRMSNKPPEGAAEINITPEEWRMLVLVDGQRTIHDIATLVGVDDFGALRGLYGLVSAGLVEVVADPEAKPSGGPGEPVEAFEPTAPPVTVPEPQVETAPQAPELQPDVQGGPQLQSTPVQAEPIAEPEGALQPRPVTEAEPAVAEATPEAHATAPDAVVEAPLQPGQIFPEARQTAESDTWDANTMSSVFKVEEPEVPEEEPVQSDRPIFGSQEIPAEADPVEAAVAEPEPEAAVEGFDEPEPGDIETHKPDPFLNDLLGDRSEQPAPPEPSRTPAPPAPSPQGPQVDRSTVVRELAGLFSDDERTTPRPEATSAPSAAPAPEGDQRKRVEDDDQLNKGLITRLIDGVKGL